MFHYLLVSLRVSTKFVQDNIGLHVDTNFDLRCWSNIGLSVSSNLGLGYFEII